MDRMSLKDFSSPCSPLNLLSLDNGHKGTFLIIYDSRFYTFNRNQGNIEATRWVKAQLCLPWESSKKKNKSQRSGLKMASENFHADTVISREVSELTTSSTSEGPFSVACLKECPYRNTQFGVSRTLLSFLISPFHYRKDRIQVASVINQQHTGKPKNSKTSSRSLTYTNM